MFTLVSPCPVHWYYLCCHSDITNLRCLTDHKHIHTHTHTHTPATVHCPLIFRRVGSTAMHRLSRDRLPTVTVEAHSRWVERTCICIRKYARNDFEGVQFLCVTVNFNLMDLCKWSCYAIQFSILGWSRNGFRECSGTKLSQLNSGVLFRGGTTLAVYIDC